MEEWNLVLWCSHCGNLFRSVEGVDDIERIFNLDANGYKIANSSNESLNWTLRHELQCILHDKFGLCQEFFEFSHLVGLFWCFLETIPGSWERKGLSSFFREVSLDYIFDLIDPGFFQVVWNLASGWFLDLLEFSYSHRFCDIWIVDVFQKHIIALFSDFLHCSDRLIFIQDWVKAEIGEFLWEVVSRNINHAHMWCFSCSFLLW